MVEKISLEEKVDQLAEEVRQLTARVDALSREPLRPTASPKVPLAEAAAGQPGTESSEEFLSWVGRSSLLQRISALCFLLVIGLILRTLTDNGLIDTQVGSLVGMVYAGTLMAVGWYLYGRSNPLAPVAVLCGALLMYMVVVETNARFDSLPSTAAYVLIVATGIAMAFISYYYHVGLPILAGTFGMCVAGVAIDYPNPSYPALVFLLFAANGLGFVASRLQRCSWLRWILFLVTAALFQAWGYKLGLTLAGKAHPANDMAQSWFLPVLGLFAAAYLGSVLVGILRPRGGRIARFDLILPVLVVAWAYSAALYVVVPRWGTAAALGAVGLGAAVIHLVLAWWLGQRQGLAAAAPSFWLAATVLLVMGGHSLTRSMLAVLPVVGALALALGLLSRSWQSGPARLLSYLLQFYLSFELGRWFLLDLGRADHWGALLVAAAATVGGVIHYRWCLNHPPPPESPFFSRLDEGNRLCVFVLFAALVNGFFLFRGGVAVVLPELAGEGLARFRGAQSLIINAGAALLMMWALLRRDSEVRNLAILITLVGGCKVFLLDLFGLQGFGIKGFPLVLAVFSFGLEIAIVSVVLGRWLRLPSSEREASDDGKGQGREAPIH